MPTAPASPAVDQDAVEKTFSGLYGGDESFDKTLTPEVRSKIAPALKVSEDPTAQRQRWANTTFLAHVYHKPWKDVSDALELYRDDYAKQVFHVEQSIDDAGFYAQMGQRFKKQADEKAMGAQFQNALIGAYRDGKDFDSAFAEQSKALEKSPGWDATRLDVYKEFAHRVYNEQASLDHSFANQIDAARTYMRTVKDGGEGLDPETTATQRKAAMDALLPLSEQQRNFVLSRASADAAKEQTAQSQRGMMEKIPEEVRRGTRNLVTNLFDSLRSLSPSSFNPFGEPEWKRQDDVGRLIDKYQEGQVDPIKGDGIVSNTLLSTAEQLPTIVSLLHPVGIAAVATSEITRLKDNYTAQGIDEKTASNLATVTAVPIAAWNFVNSKLLLGKIPGVEKLLTPLANETAGAFAGRLGIRLATETAGLAGVNVGAALTPMGTQQIASMFDQGIPGLKASDFVNEFKGQLTPEAFARLAPLVILGTAQGTFRDRAEMREYVRQETNLRAAGFTPEDITEIRKAPTPEKAQSLIRQKWNKRIVDTTEALSAIEQLKEEHAQAAEDIGKTSPSAVTPGVDLETMRNGDEVIVWAKREGKPVGSGVFRMEGENAVPIQIHTLAAHRRTGVASAIYDHVSQNIVPRGEIVRNPALETEEGKAFRASYDAARKQVVPLAKTIDTIATSSLQEFQEMGRSSRGGLTGMAHDIGRRVTSTAEVNALLQAASEFQTEANNVLRSGELTMERVDHASLLSTKAQIFREAYEAATGTGSAGKFLSESDPSYQPPIRRNADGSIQAGKVKTSTPEIAGKSVAETQTNPQRHQFTGEMQRLTDRGNMLGIVPPGTQQIAEYTRQLFEWGDAPRTSIRSEEAGNALVRYVSARMAAPYVAESMSRGVLGKNYDNPEFRDTVGRVMVQDRLDAIRQSFIDAAAEAKTPEEEATLLDQADAVTRVMSKKDMAAALANPQVLDAIEAHKQTVQPMAEEAHKATGGRMAGAGVQTGAFVNLEAVFGEGEAGMQSMLSGGSSRGNLTNPLKRGTKFGKTAKGTAEDYVTDYARIAQRMVEGNFEENSKRKLYDALEASGLGKGWSFGDEIPTFHGERGVRFPIDIRGLPAGAGKARTYREFLYVDPAIAGELRQAFDTDGPIRSAALVHLANIANRIQIAGPMDAVFHTGNMLSVLANSQGGRNAMVDLIRKIPGVNIGTALFEVGHEAIKVVRGSDEIASRLANLAEMGALRAQHTRSGPFAWSGKMIDIVDRSGRLVLDRMFDNLVARGMAKDTESNRREFVNQLGQYNSRLHGQFTRFFKEAGISPFIVAGRNFNRNGLRRLTLSPGFKTASTEAAVQARMTELAGVVMTLVAIPTAINYVLTGSIGGRPGTPFGAIDTGRDDSKGKHIIIDPAQWTGLRRGLRITGINSLISGSRKGQSKDRTEMDVLKDIFGGMVAPWSGPIVRVGSVLVSGYDPSLHRQAPMKASGQEQLKENAKAAAGELLPVAKRFLEGKEETGKASTGVESALQSLGGAFGVKEVSAETAGQRAFNLGQAYKEAHNIKDDAGIFPTSQYAPLKKALRAKNEDAIRKSIDDLIASGIKRRDLIERFHESLFRPWTGSQKHDRGFIRSLSPEDRKTVLQANRERLDEFNAFRRALGGRNAYSIRE